MTTVTYTIEVEPDSDKHATIEVSASRNPTVTAKEFEGRWYVVQVRINGRIAWTKSHPSNGETDDHHLCAIRAGMTVFASYVAGHAIIRRGEHHRHEWRGWAEEYTDHVHAAGQALWNPPLNEPFTVRTHSQSTWGKPDIIGTVTEETIDFGDGRTWTGPMVHVPVLVTRTEDPAEHWNTEQVGQWWGIDETAVSSTMQRVGVPVSSREPGRGGRNRYRVELVRDAKTRTKGRGARTDLADTAARTDDQTTI